MSDERRQRAREIARVARALSFQDRVLWVDRECGADPGLRAEVEALLRDEDGPVDPTDPQVVAGIESTLRRHLEHSQAEASASPKSGPPSVSGTARYVLKGEVGRGGMGAVLKVYDTDLRRSLAMKVILGQEERGQGGTPSVSHHLIERFLEEAQVTGQLEHPGVVPVHELGVDGDGRMYFTMRLVRGKDFDQVIALARAEEEGWNLPRALNSLLRICETVAYAHSRKVIHRDLKPANIMLGRFGETYVMDWGAARILESEETAANQSGTLAIVQSDRRDQAAAGAGPSATQHGTLIGTPHYMPREQAVGNLEEIGPHSDVYAVGCMLYQLLSGRRPYELTGRKRTVMEIVSAVVEGPPTPVRELAPNAPPELVAICEKAMAHDWWDRYPDMLEMAEDLRAYLERRVVRAYQTGTLVRIQKWVARNRALAASLAVSLLIALTALGVLALQQSAKLRAVSEEQARTALARDEALESEREARRNAERAWREGYVANIIAADASLRADEIREGKRLLAESRDELRGWEWEHLSLRADSSVRRLTGHTGRVVSVAYAPDGRRIASCSEDGTVRLWSCDDGKELRLLPDHDAALPSLAYGPAGDALYTFGYRGDATAGLWDASTGELRTAFELPEARFSPVALSDDGERLAYAAAGNVVHVVEASSGRSLHAFEGHEGPVRALTFVPGSERLLSASEDGTVRLWDLAAGQRQRTFEGGDGAVFCIAAHPTENEFLTGAENGAVRRFRPEEEASGVLVQHAAAVYGVAYGPAAADVASVSHDKTVQHLDLESGRLRKLLGHDEPVRCVAFAPGGELLVTGGDDAVLRVWDLAHGEAVARVEGPEEYVHAVAAHPKRGRFALGAHFAGTIEIRDHQDGLLYSVPGTDDPVNDLVFSSDGEWLAAAYEEEACVRIYQGEGLRLLHELRGHEASVTSVSFRAGQDMLASGSTDYTVRLYSVASGAFLRKLDDHPEPVLRVAFQPAGGLLAAAHADGAVLVWDADTGSLQGRLSGHGDGAHALAWSPDGRWLTVGTGDHDLWVWDAPGDEAFTAREPFAVLEGHEQRISSIAFSPDGARIVTGSYDASLRIWDATSLVPLLSLRGHEAPVTSVAFSADGAALVSGSFDNTVRIWRTRPASR